MKRRPSNDHYHPPRSRAPSTAPQASEAWPAFNTERRQAVDLKTNPVNAKQHPRSQIEMIAAGMREFGWTMPILVDENDVILAGHARLEAAELLQYQEVPVIVARGWSDAQKRAYVEADNRLSEIGAWDYDLRREELEALRNLGFAMDAIGWGEAELDEFLKVGVAKGKDPDATPDLPAVIVVQGGDVWQLENHRIVCGDSTKEETWAALFGRERDRAAMVFTDPPYGVSYEARSGEFAVIEGDHKRRDDLYKMLVQAFRMMARFADDAAAFYVWHASSTRTDFTQAMTAAGLVERQYLIWAKPSIGLGHSDYRWTHEPCFYASKQISSPRFYGDASETTVWRVKVSSGRETATVIGPGVMVLDGHGNSMYVQQRPPKSKKPREVRVQEDGELVLVNESGLGTVWEVKRDRNYQHPTQKPVELATRAIENSSQRDEIVVDGFAGAGTSIIGAEMTGRRAFCVELDPAYVQVCIERWQDYSGKVARLNGIAYPEVARTRSQSNAESNLGESIPGRDGSEGIGGEMAEQAVRPEVPPA